MSANIPLWYVSQYATNIQLRLQQVGSRLRGTVTTGSYVGDQASPVDQVSAVDAQKVTGRFNPMGRVDAELDRRWVFPVSYDLPQLIDSFDKLKILTDPMSSYVQNAANAMGRAQDDEILAAATGDAKTGNKGETAVSFLAGQVVSVQEGAASPTNFTVAKLKAALKLLMQAEVDLDNDMIFAPINAKAHDSLLNETQIIDTDYNEKPVLVEGKIKRFLGINFIHTERLLSGTDDQAGTSNIIPIYAKSGMHLGMWQDIRTDIAQRKDIQGLPYQAYCYGTFGATRLEEEKVVKVWSR